MSNSALAITEAHRDLADTAAGRLTRVKSLGAARATLDDGSAHPTDIWTATADLGWNGLAIGEEFGGSGFGVEELAIVLEAQGRVLCPGPFLPSAAASMAIDRGAADFPRS